MNLKRLFLLALFVLATAASLRALTVAAEDNGERKEAMSFRRLPGSVKTTILEELFREVDGLELEEIGREKENGMIVYEIEFECHGKEVALEIAANGKLLEKVVELDDDNDDEDDDK
ncbi:MAG: hypothetical protein IH991_05195 [Planctomycetes bacterium]|nr:hypothetical protein [Planctomycetota bacterium]